MHEVDMHAKPENQAPYREGFGENLLK